MALDTAYISFMDVLWKLTIASVFVLVAFSLIPLPKTKKLKTNKFDWNLLLAAFSYFGLLVLLPLIYFLFHRNDRFILFHLKQGLTVFLMLIISILIAKYFELLGIVLFALFGVIAIFAMIQASRGYYWRLPFFFLL